ncbi:hypothetical protein [Demequina sp. NBRC 110057]|uniref:hypothetical protein n=1 Tax=Demequina sp. NBRC 110057 TaxID=1570346 RepID=UPI000A03B05F|nr:hypothetical protein [Demequina sp. NBRC 110057]
MKLRKTLVAAAVAVTVGVAPATTASAATDSYPSAGDVLTISGAFVPGGTIGVTVNVDRIPQEVIDFVRDNGVYLQVTVGSGDVTIAGSFTSEVKSAAGTTVSFSATLPEADTSVSGSVNSADVVLDTFAADISGAASVPVDEAGTDGDGTALDDGLTATGFAHPGVAAGAGLLLVAGAGAVLVAARRRA